MMQSGRQKDRGFVIPFSSAISEITGRISGHGFRFAHLFTAHCYSHSVLLQKRKLRKRSTDLCSYSKVKHCCFGFFFNKRFQFKLYVLVTILSSSYH